MYAQLSLIISLHLFILPKYHAQLDPINIYLECSKTFNCGKNVTEIGYPFWGGNRPKYCGLEGLKLSCVKEEDGEFAMLDIGSNKKFRVQYINMSSREIKMERANDVWHNSCPRGFEINANFNETLFDYGNDTVDLHVFYNCPDGIISAYGSIYLRNTFTCTMNSFFKAVGFFGDENLPSQFPDLQDCKIKVRVPVNRTTLEDFKSSNVTMELHELLNPSFVVFYKINEVVCSACANSGGLCWSGTDSSAGLPCLCHDGANPYPCRKSQVTGRTNREPMKIGIGLGSAVFSIACTVLAFFIYNCRKNTKYVHFFKNRITKEDKNFEDCIAEFGSSIPKRYWYSDVKKMTKSFKDELGKGGFGSVYKGILSDNRLVAVKLLNSSKGTGEDFINEVASIGRTSHVNVVALLGFCYEGKKRALIYEFLPNGSLDKFIYRENQLTTEPTLGWKNLYDITLGIARGLEYLHRGCSTRILHLDIKPNNILLDEEYCPKISDFGLAKVYSGKESILSMKGGRGTFGYAAPEVGNKNFGGVSHKSDVYSYGVVVLEMVGGRKNLDIKMIDDNPSQLYFLEWIYKRVELDEDLSLHGEMTVEETEIAKKMIIVAFWCMQQNPSQRPSINKVIEMLEGNEALQIPPKP